MALVVLVVSLELTVEMKIDGAGLAVVMTLVIDFEVLGIVRSKGIVTDFDALTAQA